MSTIEIRQGDLADATRLAGMFRRMWLDNGVPPEGIVADAETRVARFLEEANRQNDLRMYFAMQDGTTIGGAACQRFAGLYPAILTPDMRDYGYIWGVYVEPEARRCGIGERLTSQCVKALEEMGCSHALLHAAPMGTGIYRRMGFESTNEMRRKLNPKGRSRSTEA